MPNWELWVLPIVFDACTKLSKLALKADDQLRKNGQNAERLEEAARIINKAFTACISDRSPIELSRKWGTYYITGLLFKVYFRLNKLSLCRNVLQAISVSEVPNLELFPRAHIVTFRYYLGVYSFLNEDYVKVIIGNTVQF